MRILVVCDAGLGRGFAQRCEKDGHDVKIGTLSQEWLPDLIIYDDKNKEADLARQAGYKVLGPSRWSTTVEEDTNYLNQLATSIGWNTNGVKQGTHLYISAWFNGASFISTYVSIVYRRFMSGGAGPDLTCTGVLSCFEPVTPQVRHYILDPLEMVLKKVNHRGVVHIHTFVNGAQWCVKELMTSCTNPISIPLFVNAQNSTSEILLKLFDETSHPLSTMFKWASAVQLSVPPYPYQQGAQEPTRLEGTHPGNLKHLWFADVEQTERDVYYSNGLIGYVTSYGISPFECTRRMYRTLGNIKARDLQYRNDVGRDIQPLLTSLTRGGWLN